MGALELGTVGQIEGNPAEADEFMRHLSFLEEMGTMIDS